MKYNEWYENIKKRLVDYKENILGISGSGYYGKKEEKHILPRGCWEQNFMTDISNLSYKKHDGYHHLNSSQTMCVNFFYPLFKNDYLLLSKFLSKALNERIEIEYAQFEYVNKSEYGDTNFDFYCRDNKGLNYFFEIKYTEKDIAKKCSSKDQSDAYLLEVFDKKYRPLVEKDGSYLSKCKEEPMVFMREHYQAFRNMSVANNVSNSYSIFLTMKGNEGTYKELCFALKYVGGENKHIRSLYWEDVIRIIIEDCGLNEDQVGYYIEFKKKYIG